MPSIPTPNKIKICSSALIRLGAKAISSFTDGTDRSTACANIYPGLKDHILSVHDWKFTIQKQELNQKADDPISTYSNEFQLPADRLTDGVITLYDSDAIGATPFKQFETQADGILTEATELFLDYQSNGVDEARWPPYFVELVTKAMMVELALPITDQTTFYEKLDRIVYGTVVENRRGGLMGQTMARNSREDPPKFFQDYSLLEARAQGS
jgi:hypothetical protein